MWKRVALGSLTLLLVPVVFVVRAIFLNPEGFSRMFLRNGGRFVSMAANNPRGTAVVLTGLILLTWGSVLLACSWESWREKSRKS